MRVVMAISGGLGCAGRLGVDPVSGREITGFTGIDAPYEAPDAPVLRLTPADGDPATQAAAVLALLAELA